MMRDSLTLVVVFGSLLAGFAPAWAGEAQEKPSFREQLDKWLPAMGAEQIADRQESQLALQESLFQLGAPGRESELAAACSAIAEKLGPTAAKPARVWMLRQLEFSGGTECVDALAALLKDDDAEIRDCACRALQNNPAPQANAKLAAGLHSAVDDPQRLAIVNALGYRADRASVSVLGGLLGYRNKAVAAAAASALAKIGGPQAASALRGALTEAPEALKTVIAHALLRCADQLLNEGKPSEAMNAYVQLTGSPFPRPVRLRALQGALIAGRNDRAKMVLSMLRSDDRDTKAIAVGHLGDVLDAKTVQQFADELPRLPASSQIVLLGALAASGDKAGISAAMAAAKSDNDEVRLAAIRALGKLGDASAVPILIEGMAGGAPLAEAARESLGEVFGDGVDEAIVVAMQKATIDLRAALIEILSDRGASTAVPALLAEAEHKDAGIRTRAVKALGNIAEPKNVPAVVALLLKTAKGRQRDDLEKAVMLVCNRTPQAGDRADPVIAFIARSGDEDRCTLLPLLGRIGGAKAAAEVRRAIKSGNADIREAGVRALCNWPDAAVADQLLDLARETDNQTHKTWALRAYIRVATLRSDQAPSETLGALKKAMAMADRADEKKLVLSRASAARHVDTLRWLTPFLDDSVLSAEACKAVVDLAHHRDLMGPHQAEFRKALEKVIAVSSDQGLIERARQYMSGL